MAEAKTKTTAETMVAISVMLEPYDSFERERILEAVESLLAIIAARKAK